MSILTVIALAGQLLNAALKRLLIDQGYMESQMSLDIESLSIMLLKARENAISYIKPVLHEHEITEQQWRVLRELHKHGELNAQRLAEESGILSPSLSRILARFTEDGVVVRKVDKQDQRAQNIRLSAKGQRLHGRILPKIESQYQAMVQQLGGDNLARLQHLLQQVADISAR